MKLAIKNWIETIELKWILIGVAGYAFAIFIGIYFLIQPQFDKYLNAVEKQVGLNETYINLISLDIEAAINSIEMQQGELELLKFRFNSRMLKNQSLNSLLPIIDRYCAKSNLRVLKLEPLNETKLVPPQYQKLFVAVSLVGKYSNFLKLLQTLESNLEWLLIEDLTITPADKGLLSQIDFILAVLKKRTAA